MIVLFDLGGILAHQVILQMLNGAHQRLFLILQGAFTYTGDSLVGIDLHEHPVGAEAIHYKAFHICDLHDMYSFMFISPG